jgi:hypothetical protein
MATSDSRLGIVAAFSGINIASDAPLEIPAGFWESGVEEVKEVRRPTIFDARI